MAHQLSIRENGFVEFAFTGDRGNIWHGLGNVVEEQEAHDLEVWRTKAGMDWSVEESPVQYTLPDGTVGNMNSQKVVYRSDTKAPLAVVGDKFKIVQPAEVLGFFEELLRLHDLKMSTAGVLFDGRRFFALAETGNSFKLEGVDEIYGNLLLTTAIDGSLATTAKFTSTRVVCNNTLSIALKDQGARLMKVSHKSEWDAKQVKIDMGLLDAGWAQFKQDMERLSMVKVNDDAAKRFFQSILFDTKKDVEEQSTTSKNRVEELFSLYKHGAGADMAGNTAYGLLNAVTNAYTHGFTQGRKRTAANQLNSSLMGTDDAVKQETYQKLLAMAA